MQMRKAGSHGGKQLIRPKRQGQVFEEHEAKRLTLYNSHTFGL
jgi:hypothetical protein